jgi:hypothetical protein
LLATSRWCRACFFVSAVSSGSCIVLTPLESCDLLIAFLLNNFSVAALSLVLESVRSASASGALTLVHLVVR